MTSGSLEPQSRIFGIEATPTLRQCAADAFTKQREICQNNI